MRGPATISTPTRCSRLTPRPGRSRDITSTTTTARGIGTRRTRRSFWTSNATVAPSRRWCTPHATATSGSSSAVPPASGFVDAVPYVHQNVFTAIDPRTGRPSYDPNRIPGTGRRAVFCPSHHGAKNWPPAAFNPITRLLYIPANENLWRFRTNSGVIGVPTSFAVDGRQYIAVQSGWGARAQRLQDHIDQARRNPNRCPPRRGDLGVCAEAVGQPPAAALVRGGHRQCRMTNSDGS